MEKIQFMVCLILSIPMFIFGMYHLIGTLIMWSRINKRGTFTDDAEDCDILNTLMFNDGDRYCSALLALNTSSKSCDERKTLSSKLKYKIPVNGIEFTPVVGIKHYDIFQSIHGKYISVVNGKPVSIKDIIGTTKFISTMFDVWFYLMFVRSVAVSFAAVPFSIGSIALVFAGFHRLSVVCFIVGMLLCTISYMYIGYLIDRKRESSNDVLNSRGFISVVNRGIMSQSSMVKKYFDAVKKMQEEKKNE